MPTDTPDHPDTIPAPPPDEHVLDRAQGYRELSALSDLASQIIEPDREEPPTTVRTGEDTVLRELGAGILGLDESWYAPVKEQS